MVAPGVRVRQRVGQSAGRLSYQVMAFFPKGAVPNKRVMKEAVMAVGGGC